MRIADTDKTHTVQRYDGELDRIQHLLLAMGEEVIRQVGTALRALAENSPELARQVVAGDQAIDAMEVAADREIIEVLARRCPMGSDLRLVMAVSKSIADLERIGDEAARVAGFALQFSGTETAPPTGALPAEIEPIARHAQAILRAALALFPAWDLDGALQVIAEQQSVELEFGAELRKLLALALHDGQDPGRAVTAILVIKSLARIGHHASNLAEHVVFRVKGEDIRAA